VKPIEEARLKHDSVSGQRRRGAGYATKIHGELAELAFLFKAASLGIAVAKPYGDSLPYDFMVQCGQRLLRIQVKSVFTNGTGNHRYSYSVPVSRRPLRRRVTYSRDEIDFITAFVAPHDAWYVIPVDAVLDRKFIHLYPGGKKRVDGGAYEKYREAWHLLTGNPNELPTTADSSLRSE